jgi:hypothetical protein
MPRPFQYHWKLPKPCEEQTATLFAIIRDYCQQAHPILLLFDATE